MGMIWLWLLGAAGLAAVLAARSARRRQRVADRVSAAWLDAYHGEHER
jgi:hypothetical protein